MLRSMTVGTLIGFWTVRSGVEVLKAYLRLNYELYLIEFWLESDLVVDLARC